MICKPCPNRLLNPGKPSKHGIQVWMVCSHSQTRCKPSPNHCQTYVPNQGQTNVKPFFIGRCKPTLNLVQTKFKLGVAAGQALSRTEFQSNRTLTSAGFLTHTFPKSVLSVPSVASVGGNHVFWTIFILCTHFVFIRPHFI